MTQCYYIYKVKEVLMHAKHAQTRVSDKQFAYMLHFSYLQYIKTIEFLNSIDFYANTVVRLGANCHTILRPLSAEMSRKETAEKSRTRLWISTWGTEMLAGSGSLQFTWTGRPEKSTGWSKSSILLSSSDSSIGKEHVACSPFYYG